MSTFSMQRIEKTISLKFSFSIDDFLTMRLSSNDLKYGFSGLTVVLFSFCVKLHHPSLSSTNFEGIVMLSIVDESNANSSMI